MKNRIRFALILAFAVAGLAGAAGHGGEQRALTLRIRGDADREIRGIVTAKAMDGKSAPIQIEFACQPLEACSPKLDLLGSSSAWVLSATSPGYWSFPEVGPPGGDVDLWPAGTLEGDLRPPKGAAPIGEITVRFSPAPGSKVPQGFPAEGAVVCPVQNGRFTCSLPAGTFDLRVRAKGYVSVYRWTQRVLPRTALRLGNLDLRPGASLVGRIVSNDRDAPKAGACTVRLEPTAVAGRPGKASEEQPKAGVDARGFFHLEVIPPGRWVLVAEQAGFAPARRAVTILEGMEANLKEPLALSRPARLELTLQPPQDPEGKPWIVELLEATDAGRTEAIGRAPASLAGFWSKDRLSSGRRLMVRVRTSSGHAWFADSSSFELTGPTHARTLDVGSEEIVGTVRLGEAPLAATLGFGAPNENVSIPLRSGSDGELTGYLPRLGPWHVAITSEGPSMNRVIDVDVRRGPDGKGQVEIILADRALVGEIVDEEGKRLDRAILTISATGSSRRETVQEHVEGGAFRLTGYEPGGYLLRAEGGGRVSKTVTSEIEEDGSSPWVRIVAVPRAVVDLRLVTESGSPIVGARVQRLRTTAFPGLDVMAGRTDAQGRVSFPTHPDVPQVCFVFDRPGLPTFVFSVPPGLDEQEVIVGSAGGTVEIEKPALKTGEVSLLWQGACYLPTSILRSLTGGDELRFRGLAPGQYRFCRHVVESPDASGTCSQGFLGPNGSLMLSLRP